MQCIITAGPTYEPMDQERRLTNFSTGRLGTELGNFLSDRGHTVTLLLGEAATYRGGSRAASVERFTTTSDLRDRLQSRASGEISAVFHAAAVSDYRFSKFWVRTEAGALEEVKGGKISTAKGTLLAELAPTPKILGELRSWFPKARLVGWKFEVDGDRDSTVKLAAKQIGECLTDACVANGPAYGEGFGLVRGSIESHHLEN